VGNKVFRSALHLLNQTYERVKKPNENLMMQLLNNNLINLCLMKTSRKNTVQWVSALLIIAFAGLVFILARLINKAIETNQLVFSNRVTNALHDVRDNFKHNSKFKLTLHPVIQSADSAARLDLHHHILNSITQSFTDNDLAIPFEYGLYLHHEEGEPLTYQFGNFSKKIELKNCMNSSDKKLTFFQSSFPYEFPGKYAHYHIAVYFPDKTKYLISQVSGLFIACSLLSLILIFSFLYFLRTIFRQKRHADIKNDFINNLTHEFKTPLFSIGLATGLLKKNYQIDSAPEILNYIQLIEGENNRLKNHVDKILQIALIDSGNFLLEKRDIDVHQVIREVVDSFALAIKEKKAEINTNFTAGHAHIKADEMHFRNSIYNLIDNALKYNNADHPEILIETRNSADKVDFKHGSVAITIKDNGIGMTGEVQKNIFEKFYRADNSNIHTVKGFGLGLSYVRTILMAHKGKINVQSIQGKGSSFVLQFPS